MVLTQAISLSKFLGWTVPLALLCGNNLCLPYSLLECCWATQLPGVIASISGQMGSGATFNSRPDNYSDLVSGCKETRLWGRQISWFEYLNQTDQHPTKLSSQTFLPNWFYKSAKLLVVTTTWALQVRTQSTKIWAIKLSFPTGGTIGSGETSQHCSVPAWGRDNAVIICNHSYYPSNVVCLGPCRQRMLSLTSVF